MENANFSGAAQSLGRAFFFGPNQLNSFNGDYQHAWMVKALLTYSEHRLRFA